MPLQMAPVNMGRGNGNCMGNRFAALDESQIGQANAERSAFFKATSDLRRQIHQKRLELQSEMAKEKPDGARAGSLQKDISNLDARFDTERLAHRLRMKAISPELGSGYGSGCGKGQQNGGRHQNRGNGYCRN